MPWKIVRIQPSHLTPALPGLEIDWREQVEVITDDTAIFEAARLMSSAFVVTEVQMPAVDDQAGSEVQRMAMTSSTPGIADPGAQEAQAMLLENQPGPVEEQGPGQEAALAENRAQGPGFTEAMEQTDPPVDPPVQGRESDLSHEQAREVERRTSETSEEEQDKDEEGEEPPPRGRRRH